MLFTFALELKGSTLSDLPALDNKYGKLSSLALLEEQLLIQISPCSLKNDLMSYSHDGGDG